LGLDGVAVTTGFRNSLTERSRSILLSPVILTVTGCIAPAIGTVTVALVPLAILLPSRVVASMAP